MPRKPDSIFTLTCLSSGPEPRRNALGTVGGLGPGGEEVDAGGSRPVERKPDRVSPGPAFWAVGPTALCGVDAWGGVGPVRVGEAPGTRRRQSRCWLPGACRGSRGWCDPTAPHCHLPWALPSHWASVPFRRCSLCRERPFPRKLCTPRHRFPHPGEEPPTRLCGPGPWSVRPLVPRAIRKSLKTTMCPGRRARECVRSSEPLGVWAWCIHTVSALGVGDVVLGRPGAGWGGPCPALRPPAGPRRGVHHHPQARQGVALAALVQATCPPPAPPRGCGCHGAGCTPSEHLEAKIAEDTLG